jgi:hypothetical protein
MTNTIAPALSLPELGRLAREMAVDLREKAAILQDYNLSEASYELLTQNPTYARLLAAITKEWNSVLSTPDRIKFKSALAFEDGLETLATRMANPNEPLSGAVETGKLLARVGGIGEETINGQKGEKFTINISLGGQRLSFENAVAPIEVRPIPEGESQAKALRYILEEEEDTPALCDIPEGEGTGPTIQALHEEHREKSTIRKITEEISKSLPVEPLSEETSCEQTIHGEEEK